MNKDNKKEIGQSKDNKQSLPIDKREGAGNNLDDRDATKDEEEDSCRINSLVNMIRKSDKNGKSIK